ncbi:hypothetical protein ACH4XT_09680 [Streptomyces avidinii]|uniref:hypothetical protein n=1 Tax=Streptomyces avidinii TaxID=1895 RepID=UPI0037B0A8F7
MTKPSEQQAPAGPLSGTKWDVYCPEEDLAVIQLFNSKEKAKAGANEHNANFTPHHTARPVVHTPGPDDPHPVTEAQREAFKAE